jgi:hypothetical protein
MESPKDPGPTQQEQALASVSSHERNDYVTRFRPAEKALAKKAEFTEGERAQVKGAVAADTAAAFKGLDRSTIASGGIAGADVSSGKTKLSLAGDATAAGHAKGVGQSIAETGGKVDSEQQRLKIAGFGRGVAAGVTANLQQGAVRATRLALASSEAKFQSNAQNALVAASVAGAATAKFGSNLFDGDLQEIKVTHRGTPMSVAAAADQSTRFAPNAFSVPDLGGF